MNIYNDDYTLHQDGVREYDNGITKYKIVLDRNNGLWTIQNDDGVPAPLRQTSYTSPRYAVIALKNYANKAPLRRETYKKLKKSED